MIPLGIGMVTISLMGKGAIKYYRFIKMGNLRKKTPGLGSMYKGGFQSKMTPWEASLILGVGPASNEERILKSYRKLMFLNHPDNGGSTYLSIKIN